MKVRIKLARWKKWIIGILVIPVLLFVVTIGIVYWKQDAIVQEVITTLNQDFKGTVQVEGSHVAPFASFPYISIDLEKVSIYEGKKINKKCRIAYINDAYIGFDLWTLISGKMDIKTIRLKKGELHLVQHTDGTLNIANAFATEKPAEEVKEDFHLDLKYIRLDQFDITKYNEANHLFVDSYVSKAKTKFRTNNDGTSIGLDAKFLLTVMDGKKNTYLKKKHFSVDTDISLDSAYQLLTISPTEIEVENASFDFEGKVDLVNDMDLDLRFHGIKSNFDLVLALAPEELQTTLKKFDNKGRIFFETTIKGKSLNGKQPAINARFGCKDGFFHNIETDKTLDQIAFEGSFSNGKSHNAESSSFQLKNFRAKPEAGIFSGKLEVDNFTSPDIDMQIKSDFDLDFLAKFLSIKELNGLSGHVLLTMNFHDILDIDNPEKSIARFNESYFTQLEVKKLRFDSPDLPVPVKNLDIRAHMDGHEAIIDHFQLVAGKSDIQFAGKVSDLPAVIHHTNIPVDVDIQFKSKWIDLLELTKSEKSKGVDEQIENMRMKLKFKSSAKALTESPVLPYGEFFIEDFYAKMKHYPHTLHNFHADVYIEKEDFKVVDFSGLIDRSDFHFTGRLKNYALWFDEKMNGDTQVEFDLTSKALHLDNLFNYGGENFVPEDYQHEVFSNLKLHGETAIHFKEKFESIDFKLTELRGKMKVHPLPLDRFNGHIHLAKDQLTIHRLHGKIGESEWDAKGNYFLGKGSSGKRNRIELKAKTLNWDELTNYNPPPVSTTTSTKPVDHDATFNVFDFEFPDIDLKIDAQKMNYHRYKLTQFHFDVSAFKDHHMDVHALNMHVAGGEMNINGYLSGKDKKNIYFKPSIRVKNIDLDQLMVKFDNFGQDHLVSENLHGIFSGKISGKIHLHADLVPKLDDSELQLEAQILNGKLENFSPLMALSGYFEDQQLKKVVFDTLQNTFLWKNGKISIPAMTIQSNLGFLELGGEQWLNDKLDMDYTIGVPWKMIGQVAGKKLFKRKGDQENPEEIKYRSENARLVYVRITGNPDQFDVKLGKKKK